MKILKNGWVASVVWVLMAGAAGFWAGYTKGASKERNLAELKLVALEYIILREAQKEPEHKRLSWLARNITSAINSGGYQRKNIKIYDSKDGDIPFDTGMTIE